MNKVYADDVFLKKKLHNKKLKNPKRFISILALINICVDNNLTWQLTPLFTFLCILTSHVNLEFKAVFTTILTLFALMELFLFCVRSSVYLYNVPESRK